MNEHQGEGRATRARPGGRNGLVRRRVLETARDLLDEGGYEALTHRAVAARAEVDPSTVYRRWPSRPALAVDAFLATSPPVTDVPDTGVLRADLRGVVDRIADVLARTETRRALAALMAAVQAEPTLADAARARWLDEREFLAVCLRRAAERGEIAVARATPEAIELMLSPLVLRALAGPGPLEEELREQCVEIAAAWLRATI